jgi:hypothetical protein
MSDLDVIRAVARLRRSQPRNTDTLIVCEALEERMAAQPMVAAAMAAAANPEAHCTECAKRRAKNAAAMKKWRNKKGKKK